MEHPRDIAQWVALNLASWTVVLTPGEVTFIPSFTDGAEFLVKMAVGVSVIVLNIIKIRDWSKRKYKDEDQ